MIKKKRPASTAQTKTKKSLQMSQHGNQSRTAKRKKVSSKSRSRKLPESVREITYQKFNQSKVAPLNNTQVYLNGLSLNQWKTITNFQIAGQTNKKKMNFNVAIDHYFNLKSMYRKINAIKLKPSSYSF